MKKCDELAQSRSCWNKAKDDEIVFVLLGRDKASPATIREWAKQRVLLQLNTPDDPQILEALTTALEIEEGFKTPEAREADKKIAAQLAERAKRRATHSAIEGCVAAAACIVFFALAILVPMHLIEEKKAADLQAEAQKKKDEDAAYFKRVNAPYIPTEEDIKEGKELQKWEEAGPPLSDIREGDWVRIRGEHGQYGMVLKVEPQSKGFISKSRDLLTLRIQFDQRDIRGYTVVPLSSFQEVRFLRGELVHYYEHKVGWDEKSKARRNFKVYWRNKPKKETPPE